MIRVFILTLLALNLLVSCVSSGPYKPATKSEGYEFTGDRIDIYPNDVRNDLDRYTNTPVAWVGVIRGTDAREEDNSGKIRANTTFDHHYFDWVQNKNWCNVHLQVSQRGEGQFRTQWRMRKIDPDADAAYAQHFAGKDKLAIVYGIPVSVDPDGTVVLRYRYLRVFDRDHFTTNQMNYGRLGDVFLPASASK